MFQRFFVFCPKCGKVEFVWVKVDDIDWLNHPKDVIVLVEGLLCVECMGEVLNAR